MAGAHLAGDGRGVCGCGEGVRMPQHGAVKTENVLMRAGECLVSVLPRFGGKIASIRIGDRELMQAPLAPIETRTRTMVFDAGDASGWDECLPSVAACQVETEAGVAAIPDHGDLWRLEWEVQGSGNGEPSDISVTLAGKCFSLPLRLERRMDLRETENGWRLGLQYTLTNDGAKTMPWSWAAHPLFAAEKGDRIVLPDSIKQLRLEGSGGERLGRGGHTVAWPRVRLKDGSTADMGVVEGAESGIGDKLFAGPLKLSEDWCALERPSAGVRVRVRFDVEATPYLGLWICYGGWPDRPGPKQMCVAMEPSTAPVDSLAVTGKWSRALGPGESFSWPMNVEIERIER